MSALDRPKDIVEGIGGAAIMLAAFSMPFLRRPRSHWGLDAATAASVFPGDDLVPRPRWSWTHGIEIGAPAEEVWPWVAQVGADHGGFYSYQWLENIAGCGLRNTETIHPEWEVKEGDGLSVHPRMPRLPIVSLVRGQHFVAYGAPDEAARSAGRPWIAVTWLFLVEPLGDRQCRFVSRYRCASSEDLGTWLAFGPTLIEPVGFAMDRRMLLGVKRRAEWAKR
jgi:hypothetical protein